MERWVILRKGADFASIGKRFHISPRLACLIRNRDIIGEKQIDQFLNGTIADLYDGMLMKDMDKAVEILMEKIKEQDKIRIIGDYDIDGVNATYILLDGLEHLGADVDMDIPDRITDGYGLNKNLIDRAFDSGIDTIVTCDNGIAAAPEISYGKSLGMTIVVTDHHEIPYQEQKDGNRKYLVPPADAVVDPKQKDCEYPFKELCGAGVAYKLIEALYGAMGRDPEDADYLMEEVAFATVGDVMDLVGENRIFVKQGLEMMKRTSNKGLQSLMACTGVDVEHLNAYHIGFVLGPCMNASGRLDTAKRALSLLKADSKKDADVLAADLTALNESRKELTEKAVQEAVEIVETTSLNKDKVLVIYLPDCHESIAGIVAGRIRERYYKPVFVLTDCEEGVKGSGRSIEGYHMFDEMNRCKELFTKFGGHKLAAGLSLPKKNIEMFRLKINEQCSLKEEDFAEKVQIDMILPFSCITEQFVYELEKLEPFGKGNVKPVFAVKNAEVISAKKIGKKKNMLKMTVKDEEGIVMEALCFSQADQLIEKMEEKYGKYAVENMFLGKGKGLYMSFTYYPSVNEYMGMKTLQIVITHFQ